MEDVKPDLRVKTVPLAIIGIGCLFPKADDIDSYWENIREGIDAITEIPQSHWKTADYFDGDPKCPDMTYGKRGGFLSPIPFNPKEFNLPPNTLEAVDTSQLLGLVAAGHALKDAGYGPGRSFDHDRTSVILGVTGALELVIPLGARLGHPAWRKALKDAGVSDDIAADVVERISESYVPWQENSFPGLLGNVVAGRISKHFDLGGTNCVVDAACASSFSALHLAGLELASGKADMVVTGGIDTFNSIFMYMCFSKTPALSPTGDARPFDAAGDGTILGEGLGVMVIKRLSDAERDKDKIYAVIRGIGTSSDGKGEAIYAPSASGQKKALRDAYSIAGIEPSTVGMIEAHGTGTKVGDAVEASALREIYGEADSPWCSLGSVKSQIGHTKAAAGAAGLIKAAMALHHKVIPPTIKVTKPLDEVTSGRSPFYLSNNKRPWLPSGKGPRRAAVSAFGFGGSNFHVVLEEYNSYKSTVDFNGDVLIWSFSGSNVNDLNSRLDTLPVTASWSEQRAASAISRKSFDSNAQFRLVLVTERDKTKLSSQLSNIRRQLKERPDGSWSTPDGAYFSSSTNHGKIGFLFPGQGSQYPGMLNDTACSFPQMLETLAKADAGFTLVEGRRLSDIIYPPSPFSPDEREVQEDRLRATDIAQPSIGAVSLGLYKILASFGLEADAVAGHSFGELTALCVSGRLEESDFHGLARLRGRLMSSGSEKGGMLAVSAPLATVEKIVAESDIDLVIANRNAPSQSVLSGAVKEIVRAEAIFSSRDITCKRLDVAAAFHSQMVADAAEPFRATLEGIDMKLGNIPVFANSTAAVYPEDPSAARELLAYQLARPVDFLGMIDTMYASGVRTFVEAGPGARISGLVKSILGERDHTVLSVDSSSGKRPGSVDLARALAQLASLGYRVMLEQWDAGFAPAPEPAGKPAMTVPICGANYVKQRDSRPPATRPAEHLQKIGQIKTQPLPRVHEPVNAAYQQTSRGALADSLRMTRESMSMLLKIQEDTAQLHRRFLEGQETAARTFQTLLEQQQRLINGAEFTIPDLSRHTEERPVLPLPAREISERLPGKSDAAHKHPDGDVLKILVAVVSEKTGYPSEMLEPEMALDSDLGIDSIKRVEILSAIREKLPDAPAIGPEHIGTLRTLAEIASHLVSAPSSASPPLKSAPRAATVQAAPASTSEDILATLLAVVCEKTGYPAEMLEPDMALDSDLGIDSIKRVEILSAIREKLPDAPAIGPEHIGTLRTLAEIARHLGSDNAPEKGADTAFAQTADIMGLLLAVVSDKTGYPTEMLEPDMALDSDLGIDSIKRVEILSAIREKLPNAPAIGPEHIGTLRTLAEIARHLRSDQVVQPTMDKKATKENSLAESAVRQQAVAASPISRSRIMAVPLETAKSAGEIPLAKEAEFWVTDDGSLFSEKLCAAIASMGVPVRRINLADTCDAPSSTLVCGLIIIAPSKGTDDTFLENSFVLLKTAASSLRSAAASGGALFATVSRLDGAFGNGKDAELVDPLSGGLAGLAKTAAKEWPEVNCKAIDIGLFHDEEISAAALAGELFRIGPLEVGLTHAGTTILQMEELPQAETTSKPLIGEGEIVVITGGGRGVTAATAITLTSAYRPLLVLLGRSPEPVPEPSWLIQLADEAAIKRGIIEHAGCKLHPRDIEERFRGIIAGRELRSTLERIKAAGGKAIYRSVDIRDGSAVSAIFEEVRSCHGPIRGIIHGAGILADRLITDKSREQFSLVYSTKVKGLRSLLDAARKDDLRFLVLFSSITGRLGRVGQIDYAVANEAINKLALAESRLRPDCRTVSINWGPWDGGMVTPSLKKLFASEGVGLIGLKEGGEFLIREISATDSPVEIVAVAGDAAKTKASAQPAKPVQLSEAVTFNLTLDGYPFLRSHVLDGRAVLPMAAIVEWLAHGALHGNPGFRFHGFNDLRICKGVVFEDDTCCSLKVMAGKAEKRDSFHFVPVELTGPGPDGRSILHARAEIVLAARLPEGIRSITDIPTNPYQPLNGELYDRERLFHGPELHGIESVTGCSEKGIAAKVKAAPPPAAWIKKPFRSVWITDPLVIDSAFQMMILWSFERFGAGSLPCFAGRYRQFIETFPREGVQVVVRIAAEHQNSAHADMEFLEIGSGKLVARLDGYECIIDPSLKKAFQRNKLVQNGSVQMGAA